jgi:hypothetical protein
MGAPIRIPPLVSGGIMLTYRCTNRCRHCLYRCSPEQPDEWMAPETAAAVFDALAGEPRLLGVHLAGGEATLRMELLEKVIRTAVERKVRIDYLETNASWCSDPAATRSAMERLRDAGLPGLLVSVSLFHNEFIPFRNVRTCVREAGSVFGPERVFVYLPRIYSLLERLPGDGRRDLEQVCREIGWSTNDRRIVESYGVIPGGRACSGLRDCYRAVSEDRFRGDACHTELTGTTHFHIDLHGNLFTGLCAGLAAATVDDLHPEIEPRSHPVFHRLCMEGPYGLMLWAEEHEGYERRAGGYVSKCDLCLDVRTRLHETGVYPELRPDGFYINR